MKENHLDSPAKPRSPLSIRELNWVNHLLLDYKDDSSTKEELPAPGVKKVGELYIMYSKSHVISKRAQLPTDIDCIVDISRTYYA